VPKIGRNKSSRRSPFISHRLWLVGVFVVSVLLLPALNTHAATLASSSVALSDPRPNNLSTSYTFTGTVPASAAIKCVKWQFTDTATGTSVPAGMNTTVAAVALNAAASTYLPTPASWALNKTTNGTLLLTNAAGETPTTGAKVVKFDGITNGSTADTKYWLHFYTYNNIDCSTSPVDNATMLFIFTNSSTLTLTVDDTLSFTVNSVGAAAACDGTTTTAASTATTIPFGTVTAAGNAIVCQDLTAATNATSGYTIYARYTAQPTNALGQTILNLTPGTNTTPSAFSAAGTEAYGYSTNDAGLGTGTANRFTNPTQGWAAMTTTNAEVAFESVPVTSTTYRVGHQVGVSLITKPGTYSTTIIYTCTPIY
jgi:hypothetical protein